MAEETKEKVVAVLEEFSSLVCKLAHERELLCAVSVCARGPGTDEVHFTVFSNTGVKVLTQQLFAQAVLATTVSEPCERIAPPEVQP